jgi:hypothetical protein
LLGVTDSRFQSPERKTSPSVLFLLALPTEAKLKKKINTKLKETIERQISTNFDKMSFFYMAMETQNIFEIRGCFSFGCQLKYRRDFR